MNSSGIFNTVDVLGKAADAAWLRNEAISNNIANADTPEYKRQEVAFESELKRALGHSRFTTMNEKIGDVKLNDLNPRTYTDHAGFSYRLDKNNVDIQTENVMLAKNQTRYNALMQSINATFPGLKSVMK